MTFNQVSGPALDPFVGEEEEPCRYSKPLIQQDSGSEHSFHREKSLDKVYFGKTFQTHTSHFKSNSNSQRSSRSHSGVSDRSGSCDIMSDKAESLSSVRSGTRGIGKMTGQSGSGSSWRESLGEIRTLGSLGGQSDNDSF